MLGLAKRIGARFLLTSTSEVYGDPLQHPQVETYWGNVNPIGNNSLYNILFCEFLDATVSSNRLIELTWEISRKNRNILNVSIDFWAPDCDRIVKLVQDNYVSFFRKKKCSFSSETQYPKKPLIDSVCIGCEATAHINCSAKGCLAVIRNAGKCSHGILIWLTCMFWIFVVEVGTFGW